MEIVSIDQGLINALDVLHLKSGETGVNQATKFSTFIELVLGKMDNK